MTVRFECPVCGHKMIRQGAIARKVQTWSCEKGGPAPNTHEVTLRLRGKALVSEKGESQ
jgi:transcription elongation factor Elf1